MDWQDENSSLPLLPPANRTTQGGWRHQLVLTVLSGAVQEWLHEKNPG